MDAATASAIAECILAGAAVITGITWIVRKAAETVRTSSHKAARVATEQTAQNFDKIMRENNARALITASKSDRSMLITLAIGLVSVIFSLIVSITGRCGR